MIGFILLFLMAPSVLELPHLGYLTGNDGRLWPLHGVRGNFLLGEATDRVDDPPPGDRSIVNEDGRHWLVQVTSKGEWLRTPLAEGRLYAIDSKGFVWSAREREVTCGTSLWQLAEPVTRFSRLNFGWMAIHTASTIQATRCDQPDIYILPSPPEEPK